MNNEEILRDLHFFRRKNIVILFTKQKLITGLPG
jgi:hypothetical protein